VCVIVYMCRWVCRCVCLDVCMYHINTYTHTHTHTHIYMCVCVCIYIYIYIYIYMRNCALYIYRVAYVLGRNHDCIFRLKNFLCDFLHPKSSENFHSIPFFSHRHQIHHCKNNLSSLHIFVHHCTFCASLHVKTSPATGLVRN